ncbi:MAG: hypothetical protein ABSC02_11370 [Acidobacteriota bacterium]|jgi:hypothetical protein
MTDYRDKIQNILLNADTYHEAYYKAETFRGPSLYFHRRALDTRQAQGSVTHLEYVYATLASWGMHRMGQRGSKMQQFEAFRRSIEQQADRITEAQTFDFRAMNDQKWALLRKIFQGIKIMASGTSLVGHSKVMHHMMPNIVPPIDREYTLRYLRGKTTITNNLDQEWLILREIVSDFFIPVACDPGLNLKASKWITSPEEYPWDTSILKVVDNLVIGALK